MRGALAVLALIVFGTFVGVITGIAVAFGIAWLSKPVTLRHRAWRKTSINERQGNEESQHKGV